MVPNPNRLHTDGNGRGNVCENDFDGMVFQTVDNCPNNGKITSTDFRGIQAITLVGSSDAFESFKGVAYILS